MCCGVQTRPIVGNQVRRARPALVGFVVCLFLVPAGVSAGCFSDLIVFGDSLSDNGNLHEIFGVPPGPPYFEGRFSNGPTWVEILATRLDLDPDSMQNFATGGAKTGSDNFLIPEASGLLTQINAFVTANPEADPHALCVVWAGANDFFGELEDPESTITAAVTNIATAVIMLAGVGAETILVPNLPDLGKTPDLLATDDPMVIGGAGQISRAFNDALAGVLQGLESQLGIVIVQLDVLTLFEEVLGQPEAFGFTNVTEPCLQLDPPAVCDSPDQYLFWDGVHPTTAGHSVIADAAYQELEPLCALKNSFYRGDPNDSGSSDVSDAISILNFLFAGKSEPACMESADVNDDGSVDVTDAVQLFNWLFGGEGHRAPPAPPGPPGQGEECGPDRPESPVKLGCVRYTSCQASK